MKYQLSLAIILIYISIALIFVIVLPFLDFFNTTVFTYTSSYYYLSKSPYNVLAYPPPPNLSFVMLPVFIIYSVLGFNFFVFSFFLKILALLFTIITAFLLYKILLVMNVNIKVAVIVFYLFLFSPVLFWINFVNMQQDIFAITFSMLAFLVYLNTERSPQKMVGRVVYIFILGFATFMYFLPVLILIAIVFHSKKYTETLFKGFLAMVFFSAFIFMFHFSGIWNLTNPISAIGSGSTSVFSFIRIFGVLSRSSHILSYFQYTFIFLIIFIAILFSYFKIPIYLELSLTFTLLFFLVQIYSPDEYFWVFPFYLISVVILKGSKGLVLRLLLLQIYFIPLVILFNIYDGSAGMGTGIFYLSYPVFHNATYVLFMIPNPMLITRVLDLLLYISMAISLSYIFYLFFESDIWRNRNKNHPETSEDSEITFCRKKGKYLYKFTNSFFNSKVVKMRKVTFIVVILLLLTLPLYPLLTYSQLNGSGAPLGIFDPLPTIINSTTTYSITNHDKSVVISPTNEVYQSFFFTRNLSGEQLFLKMNVSVNKTSEVLFNTSVLELPGISVSAFSQISLFGFNELSPNKTQNIVTLDNLSSYIWGGNKMQFYLLNGTSDIYYNNITGLLKNGLNLAFFFKQTAVLPHQNVLLRIKNGNQTLDVLDNNNFFEYAMSSAYGDWISQSSTIPAIHAWNLGNLIDRNGYLYFSVNGYNIGEFALLNRAVPLELYLGKFSNSENYNNYSFYGKVSNIYCDHLNIKTKTSFQIMSNNSTSYLIPNRNDLELNIYYTPSFSYVNNIVSMHHDKGINNPSIKFGRISYSPFYLNFTVNSFVLVSPNHNLILPVSIFIDYTLPGIIIIVYYFDYRRRIH